MANMHPLVPVLAAGVTAGLFAEAIKTGANGLSLGLLAGCFTVALLVAVWKILDAVKK
jgi:hypothetical protein